MRINLLKFIILVVNRTWNLTEGEIDNIESLEVNCKFEIQMTKMTLILKLEGIECILSLLSIYLYYL